jgi:hypothetical protein
VHVHAAWILDDNDGMVVVLVVYCLLDDKKDFSEI